MAKYQKREFRIGDFWLSQRSGSSAWYRTWYDDKKGRSSRETLSTDDYETAKQKLLDWYMERRMRTAQELPPSEVTLAELFKDYLEQHAVKLRSYKTCVILLRYWEEFYKDGTVADLKDVRRQEDFREFLSKQGLAHNSVNRVLEIGRAAIRRAHKRNVLAFMLLISAKS